MKRGIKKAMLILTSVVIAVGVLSGCGQKSVTKNENNVYLNTKYADKGMVNINGDKFNYGEDNSIFDQNMGIGVEFKTDHVKSLLKSQYLSIAVLGGESGANYGYAFYYMTEEANELIQTYQNTIDQEEAEKLLNKLGQCQLSYAEIIRIPNDPDDRDAKMMKEGMESEFKSIETLGVLNQNTYYFAYNTDYSNLKMTDSEKADVKKLVDEIELFKSGICLYPSEDVNQEASETKVKSIGEFNTKTLDGTTITEESLKDYDLTMINIWATYCGPCKEEMKDLAKLYESLPENVNMTSICTDAADEAELAQKIIDTNGAKFKVIIPDDKLQESLLNYVTGVPTTFFVDKDGNMVGEPVMGARSMDEYMDEIQKRLELGGSSNESVEVLPN